MELTKEQFVKEIMALNEDDAVFNVESADSGSVYLSLRECTITATLGSDLRDEITMYKPYAAMDVVIDFDIVDYITKDDRGMYIIEMNNGMADISITRS